MYLEWIKITNFRKFGEKRAGQAVQPGFELVFSKHLNLLVGENDSGKSTIIDAVRLCLGTQSREWIQLDENDFHFDGEKRATNASIECNISGFTHEEAAQFLEWIEIEEDKQGNGKINLRITLYLNYSKGKVFRTVRFGSHDGGSPVSSEVVDLLRTVYLKPLRDAENELAPGRRSRLAQILKSLPALQSDLIGTPHKLEEIIKDANTSIEEYFESDIHAKKVLQTLNNYLAEFHTPTDSVASTIEIANSSLSEILQRLGLAYIGETAGLGSQNILYIAAELLLLSAICEAGLSLILIEEIEAHLHPQAQLRIINYINKNTAQQLLITSHSTTLCASTSLKNVIVCKDGVAYPMGSEFTNLEQRNYDFLERFMDATKANLFFARGVILVEGDAENILLPSIARAIGRPLHRYGVSIVNVGSTAFLHYSKIFGRKDGARMGIPVAVVTDGDIMPYDLYIKRSSLSSAQVQHVSPANYETDASTKRMRRYESYAGGDVEAFVSPNWTLEYEIALSNLRDDIYHCILHADKIENSPKGIAGSVAMRRVDDAFNEWKKECDEHNYTSVNRAIKIYNDTMLTNKISKAIVAQLLAKKIDSNPQDYKDKIISSPSLKYIVDAIKYVTESR